MKIPVLSSIERSVRKKIKRKRQKDVLKKYKYIHIMNNGLHSLSILTFINRYFDNSEHCFVFPFLRNETQEKIKDIQNVFNLPLKVIPYQSVNKIIFHGLFSKPFFSYLYKHPQMLSKSYWFIWGGDLYNTEPDEVADFVKKNVKGILTSFDADVYQEKYGKKDCFDVTYPHEKHIFSIHKKDKKQNEPICILVNNSADETTPEMLDILGKFKDENISIYTILSYISASHKDCRLEIMKKGYEIFGNKFKPIIDFMDKKDYAEFLSGIDIYISNQNRQQGNGNASLICSLGGKVFTKSDTSVYKKYNSLGIRYFDTYTIRDSSFDDFIAYDEHIKEQTINRLKLRMADATKVEQWKSFFVS